MMPDISKEVDHSSTKNLSDDYFAFLTPATHLLELRREQIELEKALTVQKEEFNIRMDGLKTRREDLENRELQLRASLETYDTFITDNNSKKSRAVKKAADENTIKLRKDLEIERLNDEMESLSAKRLDLLKQLHAHRKFNAYMSSVLEATDDFSEAGDILARHRTLYATYRDLLKMDQRNQTFLDRQKQKLVKYFEGKQDELLKSDMKVAALQQQLDQAKMHTVARDYEYADVSSAVSHRTLMIGRVIMAAGNLYHLLKKFGIRDTEDNELTDPIDRLEKVRMFIADMTKILSTDATSRASTSRKSRRASGLAPRRHKTVEMQRN